MGAHFIIAEEMLIPISFTYGCANTCNMFSWDIGDVENEVADNTDIPSGALSEFPLWLVAQLDKSGLIGISLPIVFDKRHQRDLKADQDSVILNGFYDYYYLCGFKIVSLSYLTLDESIFLGNLLYNNFIERFETTHQALTLSKDELSRDKERPASIHNKNSIFARMSREEKHIWMNQNGEEQAYFKYRGFEQLWKKNH